MGFDGLLDKRSDSRKFDGDASGFLGRKEVSASFAENLWLWSGKPATRRIDPLAYLGTAGHLLTKTGHSRERSGERKEEGEGRGSGYPLQPSLRLIYPRSFTRLHGGRSDQSPISFIVTGARVVTAKAPAATMERHKIIHRAMFTTYLYPRSDPNYCYYGQLTFFYGYLSSLVRRTRRLEDHL